MRHLFLSLAILITLAGCSSGTEAPVASVEKPPVEKPAARAAAPALSGFEAARAAQALWAAALDGNAEAVREVLDSGADVGAADPDGRTALMLAAFNGYTGTVRLLLARGASVADRDSLGRTPLMFASTGPFGDTVELLLESGADPNAVEESEGFTSLMFAAGEGQMEVVRTLLSHGANPRLVDDDGDVAADHASTKGHEEVARALEQADVGN
ncbi:MAG: ankyrin repeat domain-containing protein [Acidobacteriota bacterium]|nr:ankyrin repeat domain-containing protein [Acidobacteriota bacterium]